LQHL